jgi:hypothetical protein
LFSSPPHADAAHIKMYSSGCTSSGSKQHHSPGAWVKSRPELGTPLQAVLESSSSGGSQQQQFAAKLGQHLPQKQRQRMLGLQEGSDGVEDDCVSTVDDGRSSSVSSNMATSQVEAWQQAVADSLGRALSKLQPMP